MSRDAWGIALDMAGQITMIFERQTALGGIIAAIDTALWDLKGKMLDAPVWSPGEAVHQRLDVEPRPAGAETSVSGRTRHCSNQVVRRGRSTRSTGRAGRCSLVWMMVVVVS